MIHGNIDGIRQSTLDALEKLYEWEIDDDTFAPTEMIDLLAQVSCAVNREISVYLSRGGEVLDVTIGGLESVPLADMHQRRNLDRLAMVRCIHTHPGGSPFLSDVDIQALKTLRLDAMAAVGVLDGKPTQVQAAFLGERVGGVPQAMVLEPAKVSRIPQADWMREIEESDRRVMTGEQPNEQAQDTQRAILVGTDTEASLTELARLADTAGIQVVGSLLQRRDKPDKATYLGSGKAAELALDVQGLNANMVIFDAELSGAQTRNLEEMMAGAEVVDRTVLILAIFAQRAQSREGRLQVELAQLNYQLPRLIGYGLVLSRLGAGSGLRSRGPGETKLELDRRRIRRRVNDLEREIGELNKQRDVRRARRQKNEVPVVALVGYTNAGKSTLLNRISGAGVLAEDKLFATLDPVTRNVRLPQGGEFLLVDTVGFIHKLPHALVKAFRSTLEEAMLADLLVIVSDASSPELIQQHNVVDEVLASLNAGDKPRVEVLNKCDACAAVDESALRWQGAVAISAKDGTGMDELMAAITAFLRKLQRPMRVLVPYEKGALLAQLHDSGRVLSESYEDSGTAVVAMLDDVLCARVVRELGAGAVSTVS